jgi:hypothetical protein
MDGNTTSRRPILTLRADDDPEANGRIPVSGEPRWTARIPLEDGTELHLCMGEKSRRAFVDMFLMEAQDDAKEAVIQ